MVVKLYDIAENFKQLELLFESEEIDEQTFKDTVESIEMDIEDKADNYAKIIKNFTADIKAIKEEEKRLKAKRMSLENKVKWLKSNLENSLLKVNKKKFKTTLFSFYFQKNKVGLNILDKNKIPSQYFKTIKEVDSAKVTEELQTGKKIEGVELKQGEGLRIR